MNPRWYATRIVRLLVLCGCAMLPALLSGCPKRPAADAAATAGTPVASATPELAETASAGAPSAEETAPASAPGPVDYAVLTGLPGADDPELAQVAGKVLYPCGISLMSKAKPYLGWEAYAKQVERRSAAAPSPFAHWLLAQIQLNMWWCGESDEPLESATRNAAEAVRLAPDSVFTHGLLAQVHSCRSDYDAAFAELDRARELDAQSVFRCITLGDVERSRGEYAAALSAYDQALQLDPRDYTAQLCRGHVLDILGRKTEALAAYQAVISLAPQFAWGYLNAGRMHYYLAEYGPARELLEQALALDESLAEAHEILGDIFLAQGMVEQALTECNWAIALAPKEIGPRYSLGNVYYQQRQFDRALEEYTRARDLDPEAAHAWCAMGLVLCDLERHAEARSALKRAMELSAAGEWEYDKAAERLAALDGAG